MLLPAACRPACFWQLLLFEIDAFRDRLMQCPVVILVQVGKQQVVAEMVKTTAAVVGNPPATTESLCDQSSQHSNQSLPVARIHLAMW